ncbi:ribosome hibernation-promoting factor, HPF/YfiA family [Nostocoides vanveenii]|jgi:ribosomal subunit interface protein|uniref:Ribosome hibernation promoting factor n=1 Tax=Nostocoides vanveenii TaxID=330835 RepID=A0ABN2L4P6_9MICO
MDVVISGRHQPVSESFRDHVNARLTKVEALAPRALRIEVMLTHEPTRSKTKASERVEITCHARGPVVRAEAIHEDKYAAFDLAQDKLVERLRRANDRRRVSRGRKVEAAPAIVEQPATAAPVEDTEPDLFGAFGDSPIEVREKVHESVPMTLSDALREMELVGHDFFLFHDSETDKPSVVYRRRGWKYGVIHLEVGAAQAALS